MFLWFYRQKKVGCQSHCSHIQSLLFEHRLREWQMVPSCVKYFPFMALSFFHSRSPWQPSPAAVLAVVTEPIKYTELMSFQNFPVKVLNTGFVLIYLSLKFMNEPPFFLNQSPWESSSLEGDVSSCKWIHRPWGYILNHWGAKNRVSGKCLRIGDKM